MHRGAKARHSYVSHRLVDQRKGLRGHSFVLLIHVAVIGYAEVSLHEISATKSTQHAYDCNDAEFLMLLLRAVSACLFWVRDALGASTVS